jgi:hypothetical protein
MKLSLDILQSNTANIFITSYAYYRSRPQKIMMLKRYIPVYVLKSNTPNQIRQLFNTIYTGEKKIDPIESAVVEAQSALPSSGVEMVIEQDLKRLYQALHTGAEPK